MRIAGVQKNSFVDYPGRISAVVFTPGCNMNCFYCHNRSILSNNAERQLYTTDTVLKMLTERKRFLDGVVVSGGEPTLQEGLQDFLMKVKELGYSVKLDTNGSNPEILRRFIDMHILDYVAMDLKAPMHRYEEICGVPIIIEDIEKSIDLLMEGKVDYEFRTTVVPQLQESDILCIANRIKGARLYILQQYRQPQITDDIIDYRLFKTPHNPSFIVHMAERVKGMVVEYQTRGVV